VQEQTEEYIKEMVRGIKKRMQKGGNDVILKKKKKKKKKGKSPFLVPHFHSFHYTD
jgi:hypothetical protein